MIGIQWHKGRGTVAISTETEPRVVGTGENLAELVTSARERLAEPTYESVVAVPAWYNDTQRQEIRDAAIEAGLANPWIANEPSAVALAFGLSRASIPESCLVLGLSDTGVLDVTLLAVREPIVEILATNAVPDLDAQTRNDPDRLFETIETPIRTTLKDAGKEGQSFEMIVLSGDTGPLKAIADRIESTFGVAPEEPPQPESAIARGAVLYGLMLAKRGKTTAKTDTMQNVDGSGCLAMILLIDLMIYLIL